jgi:hypothetical protein
MNEEKQNQLKETQKNKQFTVEAHNELISDTSAIIEELLPYKERLEAKGAIKSLAEAIGKINELYIKEISVDQNKEDVHE